MYRFRGVATKYLNNYLSLFKFLKSSNFNDIPFAINIFIEEISKISIENTYINMRNAEICFDWLVPNGNLLLYQHYWIKEPYI